MIQRWLTALIGVPILCVIFIIPNNIPFLLLIIGASLIINIEIMNLASNNKSINYPAILMSVLITFSITLNFLFSTYLISINQYIMGHAILGMIFFYISVGKELSCAFDFEKNIESIGFNFLIYVSLVIAFPLVIILKNRIPHGIGLFLLFTFTWLSDALGLFVGKYFGKIPLEMLPSKTKTLEGYLGSFLFTTLIGVIFYYLQGFLNLPFHWPLLKWALFGLTMSVTANFGDLTESLIKRWANQKDSGNLLPGLGGLFDTIDSQIYSLPVIFLFL